MEKTLKSRHIPRYGEIGRLLMKHRDAFRLGRDGASVPDEASTDAEELARRLEELGPTFIKLGQLLSTRADLLPSPYLDALSRLRDDVAPIPAETVRTLIEDELGFRTSVGFSRFDNEPIASASLGQVHRACLRDGTRVAVKLQRPGAREQVLDDMEVLGELAHFIERHDKVGERLGIRAIVDEFRRSLLDELDYHYEAENLKRLGRELADYDKVVVPQPIEDYTTGRILTMELLDGRSIGSITLLARTEIEGSDLLEQLFCAYLDQVLIHGFFHADPHPGNILLTKDRRLGLVDLGMVAHVSSRTRSTLLRLLFAIADGAGEEAADALEQMSETLADFDRHRFRRDVSDLIQRNHGAMAASIQTGALLGEVACISSECGLRPASELTLLMKALLNLDEVARLLDPTFDPNTVLREHSADLMQRHMREQISPRRLLSTTLEAKEFVEHLPSRLNRVMDSVAEGQFRLKIEGFDDPELMRGIQKLANRVTAGIVIAALVVAAALFSDSPANQTFGYRTLTIVFLCGSVIGAVWLAVSIVRADVRRRAHRR